MGEDLRRKSDESHEHYRQAQTERTDSKRKKSGQGASVKAER